MQDYYDIKAASSTFLIKLWQQSPGHAMHHYKSEQTASMAFGEAFHCRILEQEKYDRTYRFDSPVNPKTGRPYGSDTKAYASWLAELAQDDLVGLTKDDAERIERMAEQVDRNSMARCFIEDTAHEKQYHWTDEKTGVDCKAKLDAVNDAIILDVKTTTCASHSAFTKSVGKYRYDMQAAFYRTAAGNDQEFMWLVCESTAPYACAIYPIHIASIDEAERDNERALALYAKCVNSGEWPLYGLGVGTPVACPRWAK